MTPWPCAAIWMDIFLPSSATLLYRWSALTASWCSWNTTSASPSLRPLPQHSNPLARCAAGGRGRAPAQVAVYACLAAGRAIVS